MAAKLCQRSSVQADASVDLNFTDLPDNSDDDFLLLWAQLLDRQKGIEYIHTGYRRLTDSKWASFRSMGSIHNETGNIYSHLPATVCVFWLAAWYYRYATEHYPQIGTGDLTVFDLFFLGGVSCFAYHVLSHHSPATHDSCHKLDFLGMITVTSGCCPPGLWYTLPCASHGIKTFWIILNLLAQLMAPIFVLFVNRLRTRA